VDVRNGKIYVLHDGTEEGIANCLIEAGIPANQIVLCFHHPTSVLKPVCCCLTGETNAS
jgi:hypothetical protein